ncbi:hypothetical protein D3C83_294010 [compost metagenome]
MVPTQVVPEQCEPVIRIGARLPTSSPTFRDHGADGASSRAKKNLPVECASSSSSRRRSASITK